MVMVLVLLGVRGEVTVQCCGNRVGLNVVDWG